MFNKPYRVLSQFSRVAGKRTLADFIDIPGVYPAGRLDYESEGLLLLTDDGRLQYRITHPRAGKWKTYLVQVEGLPDEAALERLRRGVPLKEGLTRPARVRRVAPPDWLWPRRPPIRYRKTVPDSWLEIALREGRNRQVRRMTAAVGHPTLRLIRVSVDRWTLDGLAPGQYRVIERPGSRPRRGRIARDIRGER